MNNKVIGHIDADCFYVSCERVRDPRLIGKPVGVLGNQGACVIARSYEMRPFGVRVGMPIWKAKQLCPEGIYIKRDFQWYEVLSRQMQDILNGFSDTVEYYSVDESFVDFGTSAGNLEKLALTIQQKILREVGVPVSVGISLTRTLAKIASEKNKPLGIQVVEKHQLENFLASCSSEEIPGIGRKLKKRIFHLPTALDYIKEPQQNIRRLLHKPGEELWYELQGVCLYPIRAQSPQRKIISRGGSLWGIHTDYWYIWGFLIRNLERFVGQLIKEDIEIPELTLILITSEGLSFKSTEKLADYTNSYNLILQALKKTFKQIFIPGHAYSYVHIIGNSLRSNTQKQLNLFDKEDEKQKQIASIKQQLNKKYGPFTLRSAATMYIKEVFEDETSNYEICDIDGKICF